MKGKNMVNKYGILLSVCLGICLLSGCVKSPEVESGEGTAKAEGKGGKAVEEIMQSQGEDLSQYDFLTETENGYVCKVSLGDGKAVLNIDAEIENTGEEEVSVLEAKANIAGWDKDKIKEAFFEGKEGVEDITDIALEEMNIGENEEETADDEEIEQFKRMSDSHFLQLKSQDETELFLQDIALYYSDDELLREGKRMAPEKEEKDVEGDFSLEAAWNMVEKRFGDAGLGEIKRECGIAENYEGGEMVYSLHFTTRVKELPLVTSTGSVSIDELVAGGYAVVRKAGIEMMQMENGFWDIQTEKQVQIFHIGQLINLLEQYVSEGRIQCSDELVFKKCELSYFLSTDDWQNATLTPVWRIYIPFAEKIEENIDTAVPCDIVIDASTGEILRMQ